MNYKKVIEDYQNGTLKDWVLVFDNDGGYWRHCRDEYEGNVLDKLDKTYGICEGYEDLVELAQAAGIKAEWC